MGGGEYGGTWSTARLPTYTLSRCNSSATNGYTVYTKQRGWMAARSAERTCKSDPSSARRNYVAPLPGITLSYFTANTIGNRRSTSTVILSRRATAYCAPSCAPSCGAHCCHLPEVSFSVLIFFLSRTKSVLVYANVVPSSLAKFINKLRIDELVCRLTQF